MKRLPTFLAEMLNCPPKAGGGVHNFIYRAARHLHPHLPPSQIVDLLRDRTRNCGRFVPTREIEEAVRNSQPVAWRPREKAMAPPKRKWPQLNLEKRKAIVSEGPGLADLWELSNPRLETSEPQAEAILDTLFPGNPLLCCGRTQREFETKDKESWRGSLETLSFIVPSPMSSTSGRTKDGRVSAHCLENTGPRRFLVCEFDEGTPDEHAALLIHLGTFAPLVCVVHSGGKSLHGWFLVEGQPDEKVKRFFDFAVSLGADPAMWTPSQFARIPDGKRENGKRQCCYYLNRNPLCK